MDNQKKKEQGTKEVLDNQVVFSVKKEELSGENIRLDVTKTVYKDEEN